MFIFASKGVSFIIAKTKELVRASFLLVLICIVYDIQVKLISVTLESTIIIYVTLNMNIKYAYVITVLTTIIAIILNIIPTALIASLPFILIGNLVFILIVNSIRIKDIITKVTLALCIKILIITSSILLYKNATLIVLIIGYIELNVTCTIFGTLGYLSITNIFKKRKIA